MEGALLQYGVLGIGVLAFGTLLYKQWMRMQQRNDDLEKRIDQLQEQMRKYLDEERKEMLQVIRENTQAFAEFKDVISSIVKASLETPRVTTKTPKSKTNI